jgi:hypothetical protein
MNTPVTGTPRILLRLEGLMVLVAAIAAYRMLSGSWLLFVGLFLVPDLSATGYLMGPSVGARAYNVVHTYLGPGLLAAAMGMGLIPVYWQIPLIWIGHIGLDRAVGYGLKYPTAFRDTHLGQLGRGLKPQLDVGR